MARPADDANDRNDSGLFELDHRPVSLIHCPSIVKEKYCRFLYIDMKRLNLGRHSGYKFFLSHTITPTGGPTTQGNVQDSTCSHPFDSSPKSWMRSVGWVRREGGLEAMREICERVLRAGHSCCRKWTNAVIEALRVAGVLLPLRESDDRAIQ